MNNEVKTISDIFSIIERNFPLAERSRFGLWFRGHSDYKFTLIPKIFRQGKAYGNVAYKEMDMFRDFYLLQQGYDLNNKSTFEILSMMQHYGIPTRLLDWTENLLVALYFATKSHDIDGALFIFNPVSLNLEVEKPKGAGMFDILNYAVSIRSNLSRINDLTEFLKTSEIKKIIDDNKVDLQVKENKLSKSGWQRSIETPIAVRALQNNPRLISQKGVFTLHGGKIYSDKIIIKSKELEEIDNLRLIKIIINKENKNKINNELEMCGINESTLFPELDKISSQIKERWTFKL